MNKSILHGKSDRLKKRKDYMSKVVTCIGEFRHDIDNGLDNGRNVCICLIFNPFMVQTVRRSSNMHFNGCYMTINYE